MNVYDIYKATAMLVSLRGCETWSLVLRKHKLRVSGNRVLREIICP